MVTIMGFPLGICPERSRPEVSVNIEVDFMFSVFWPTSSEWPNNVQMA